jgi:hypothetical protein
MPFKKVTAGTALVKPTTAAATPKLRIKPKTSASGPERKVDQAAAPKATAHARPETVMNNAPAKPAGILTAAQRAAMAAASKVEEPQVADVEQGGDTDDLSWTYSGDEAAAKAAEIAARKEEEREQKRARGYWPIRFGLIPPSPEYPDRHQADVIILDSKPGPIYWEHVLRNPRTGFWDIYEPCPKEHDSCPLCPPNGERPSQFVMLLTVLNINGFTYKRGPKAGQHIPITKELMAPLAGDHPFFHELLREHGTLRGIQLTMTRRDRYDPQMGKPSFVGRFDDEAIENYIKGQGMWEPKITREGEKIAEADHMMHPFRYAEFLHKPSGADLRARYANGVPAPVGAATGTEGGQWGGSRYQPPVAGGPSLDDLDDDLPF